MSKFLLTVVIIALIGVAALAAYKFTSLSDKNETSKVMKQLEGKRALVLFFSRAGDNYKVGYVDKGNTAIIADYITEMAGADEFEIKSKKNYDIPYKEMLGIVREEWENDEYPEYQQPLKDIDKYDVIFIGGPIWWGSYPRVMFSFFKDHNLDGKILIPFTTNGGSGLGNTTVDLRRYYPKATIVDGFAIDGQEARKPEAREAVKQWLDSLDLSRQHITEADGTTGATQTVKPLSAGGEKYEVNTVKNVDVEFEDGTVKQVSLAVNGAVDMGDGLLWGTNNLGADAPWEAGNHYAWGENTSKANFSEDNYPYLHNEIGSDISKTWYDAARKELGGDWRLPTKDEWHKLLFSTTHEWATIDGHAGYLFTAKNGNRLFFPANGYQYGNEIFTPDEGLYWSSTNANRDNAYSAYLPSDTWGISNYPKQIGLGIRPVK